jgi:hypothetical protein
MALTLAVFGAALGLFTAMLLCMRLGMFLGQRRRSSHKDPVNLGTVEAAVFALLGLLVAFTFSGAATRFEARHQMAVEEVTAISTAWQRLDVLPESLQHPVREEFRAFVDARLRVYRTFGDVSQRKPSLALAEMHQQRLWSLAVDAATHGSPQAPMLVLPAIGEMRDKALVRVLAADMHTPLAIYVVLCLIALVCSLLIGVDMGLANHRSWVHMLTFAGCVSIALYLIFELEFPRQGLVRTDSFDRPLLDVRQRLADPPI